MSKMHIDYVDADSLSPNPWNPNVVDAQNQLRLEASIERLQMFKPVIVRETEEGLQIIGGQHRWQYLSQRGEQVPIINLGAMSDDKAKEIGLVDNGRYGDDDPVALKELVEGMDASLQEITSFMPVSNDELVNLFESVDADYESVMSEPDYDGTSHDFDDDSYAKVVIKVDPSMARFVVNELEEVAFTIDATDEDRSVRLGKALISKLEDK